MRYVYLIFGLLVVLTISIAGFRGNRFDRPPIIVFDDMDFQPRYHPQGTSEFFADNRADRPVPANTVPYDWVRGQENLLRAQTADGEWVRGFPMELTDEVMQRGRERYDIYCAVCHGATGDGQGITREYGMLTVPTYHDERLRALAEGEIYNVITNGRNTMFPYGDKIPPDDRWAIVAYVRALQRAFQGTVQDVPADKKPELGL